MGIVEKIRKLARVQGTSIANIEKEFGWGNGTIAKSNEENIKAERLYCIALKLGTTMEYLIGKDSLDNNCSDTKPAALSEDELEILKLYRNSSRLAQMQAFNILSNSAEEKREDVMNA